MERFSDRGSIPLASTTRLSLDAIRGGMMPRPIRGRLSLHPFRERTSCGSRLNALAQVACLWLRSFVETFCREGKGKFQ